MGEEEGDGLVKTEESLHTHPAGTALSIRDKGNSEDVEWTSARVTRHFASGALSLGVRQVFVQGSNLLSSLLLARMLSPTEFGLYAVAVFWLSFLSTFGGTGFAANLIRQPSEPTLADYRSVFSIQLVIVLGLAATLWAAAPTLAAMYRLSTDGIWLFRLIALSLFTTAFIVIPQVQLERHLDFARLARVEVAQAITFNVTAVYLAWRGCGVLSFGIAMLLRAAVGATLANWIKPWAMRWHWDLERAKPHLAFALPFQGAQFISVIKDSISPIFIGLLLGASAVGYVNWAGIVAAYSLLALMVLQRIYLPAFARLQYQPSALGAFVERILLITNATTAPLAVLTLVLIDPITHLLFGDKWLPALPLFYLLWAANIFVPTATPLYSLLNATGYARKALGFSLLWMVGTWLIGAPLIIAFGTIGFAIANLLVQFSNLWLYQVAKSIVKFRVLPAVIPTWIMSIIMGIAVLIMTRLWVPGDFTRLILYLILGLAVYFLMFYLFYKKQLREIFILVRGSAV
ncbi:oligosaccharide flippase family protein [Acidithiobacillus ferriphilus]|uniref:oligosaccharide flippase family protein n=1 Tax=Acidithiobacillus ferriphilus TaxID=1689834 RepID=UPI00390C99A0